MNVYSDYEKVLINEIVSFHLYVGDGEGFSDEGFLSELRYLLKNVSTLIFLMEIKSEALDIFD